MTEKKTAAPRKTTARKVTPKAAGAKTAATKRVGRPKAGPKVIRNLRRIQIHLRIENSLTEKKYRISLKPRGMRGDTNFVPVEIQKTAEYARALHQGLFEVISQAEADAIEYPPIGYREQQYVQIIRDGENVIATEANTDTSPRRVPQRSAGRLGEVVNPVYADVPGSDTGLHETLRAGEGVPQAGAPTQPGRPSVRIERTRG